MTLRPTLSPTRTPSITPSVLPSNPPQNSPSLTTQFTDWIHSNQIIVGSLIIVVFMMISICLYYGIRDVKRRRLEAFSNSNHYAAEGDSVDYARGKVTEEHKEIMKNISHDIPYEDIYGRKSKSWDENMADPSFNCLNQKNLKEEFLKQYKENIDLRNESSPFIEPSIDPAIYPLAKSENILSHEQLERLIIATKFLKEDNISFQLSNRFYHRNKKSTENNRAGRFFSSPDSVTTTNKDKEVPSTNEFAAAPESNLQNLLSKFSTISNVSKGSPNSAGSTSDNDLNSVTKSHSKEDAPTRKSSSDQLDTESGYNWPLETPPQNVGPVDERNSSLFNLVQRLSSTLANPYSPLIATEGLNMDLELSREEVRPVDYAVREPSPTASATRSRSNSTDSASRIHKLRQSQQRVQTAGQTVKPIVVGRSQREEIDKLLNNTGKNSDKRLII